MWPARGLNSSPCPKNEIMRVSSFQILIYTIFYLGAVHIANEKHNIITYFGLLSFKLTVSNVNQQEVNLLNMDASYVNYFTVPLQSYSLHSFLLCHWHRSDYGGSHILHCLPCRSTLLCKQFLFCCRSCFAGKQTPCTSSAYSIRLTGADAFLIGSGTRSSPSFVYPWPSIDSGSCMHA